MGATMIAHDYTETQLTPMQALRSLCSDLAEVESELAPLNAQREHLRNQISELLTRIDGEQAVIKGFGTVRLMGASVTDRWDGKALADLAYQFEDNGQPDIAKAIRDCKEKTMRSGGLRVERER
jgi:hypothetical protein